MFTVTSKSSPSDAILTKSFMTAAFYPVRLFKSPNRADEGEIYGGRGYDAKCRQVVERKRQTWYGMGGMAKICGDCDAGFLSLIVRKSLSAAHGVRSFRPFVLSFFSAQLRACWFDFCLSWLLFLSTQFFCFKLQDAHVTRKSQRRKRPRLFIPPA